MPLYCIIMSVSVSMSISISLCDVRCQYFKNRKALQNKIQSRKNVSFHAIQYIQSNKYPYTVHHTTTIQYNNNNTYIQQQYNTTTTIQYIYNNNNNLHQAF